MAMKKIKPNRPPLYAFATYSSAVSHMSQPQSPLELVPTSHQTQKCRIQVSTRLKRCHEDDPPERSKRAIKCQTGAFITICSEISVMTIPHRINRSMPRTRHKQSAR